jgi:hypothetical protein
MTAPDKIWLLWSVPAPSGRISASRLDHSGEGYPEYIRSDLVAEAVARERSEAILEFCRKAGISDLQQVQALPHDVKMFRLAAAIRARGQD